MVGVDDELALAEDPEVPLCLPLLLPFPAPELLELSVLLYGSDRALGSAVMKQSTSGDFINDFKDVSKGRVHQRPKSSCHACLET